MVAARAGLAGPRLLSLGWIPSECRGLMGTTLSNMNLKISFPTDGAKLMKCKLVSHSRQMELPVSTWFSSRKVVTGVVPTTAPSMAKLEQDNNSQNWKIIGIF